MYHEYPYTTYYNDIDRMCKCCKALNIHLDTHGDYLRLINDKDGSVISAVKISYADKALTDIDGNPIKTYIINAGTNGTHLVFTKGNNEVISFEVPFAKTAAKDVQEKDILDYVYGVSISGDKVRITNGDGTVYELTVPFATAAAETVDGYDLTMLACSLITDGNELVLRDTKNRELSRITPNFAVKAQKDVDGDDIKSTYANSMTQTATTLKLLAKDGTVLDEETINYAVMSLKDTDGNLFLSDYAEKIVVDSDGKRIGVEAHDGTRLATITVPFATLSTDATNAVENVQVSGDTILFTTFGGQTFSITAPYATKAQKDDIGNTIKSTYFAGVSNDTDAGTITFYDALGQVLATIQNGVITHAIYDDYDNPLAGYIKAIQATAGSDYLTATHGDGTVDSIKVDYSERAWKDTNGNVIKNTYIKTLSIAQDPDDGQWKLFAFNGDTPAALLFALVITAEKAYKDVNGKLLTSYLAHVDLDDTDLISKDGEDNEVDRLDLTHLPYGVDLQTNGSNIELLDPDGNVLGSAQAGAQYSVSIDSQEIPSGEYYDRMSVKLTGSDGSESYAPYVDFDANVCSLRKIDNAWTVGDGAYTLPAGTHTLIFGDNAAVDSNGMKLAPLSSGCKYDSSLSLFEAGGGYSTHVGDSVARINGIPAFVDNWSSSVVLPYSYTKDEVTINRKKLGPNSGLSANDKVFYRLIRDALRDDEFSINVYKQSGYPKYGYEVVIEITTSAALSLSTQYTNVFDIYTVFRNTVISGLYSDAPASPY